MGFVVVAHPRATFERLVQERQERAAVGIPGETGGAALFQSAGCAACHRIAAALRPTAWPAPTRLSSGARRKIGAGILPNNQGTLMGWIANSQAIKPNNRMPNYAMLSAAELRALADYLEARR